MQNKILHQELAKWMELPVTRSVIGSLLKTSVEHKRLINNKLEGAHSLRNSEGTTELAYLQGCLEAYKSVSNRKGIERLLMTFGYLDSGVEDAE